MRESMAHWWLSAVALACTSLAHAQMASGEPQWLRECVGRLELSLPGPSEQAAWDADEVAKDIRGDLGIEPATRYPDGQRTFRVNLSRGPSLITHPLSDAARTRMRDAVNVRLKKDIAMLKARDGKDVYGDRVKFEPLDWTGQTGKAWRIGSQLSAFTEVGKVGLWWRLSNRDGDVAAEQAYFASAVAKARPRDPNVVPTMPGLCMPYIFIPDDGVAPRFVEANYRLKGQPDVIVGLEDKSATPLDLKMNARMRDPEGVSDFFWTARYQDREEVRSVWKDRYRSITIAGVKGVESFVRLRREDGTIDHGYLIVALGRPGTGGSSSVMLYVIQRADFAKKAGVAPLDQSSFLALAREIAARVKIRATEKAQ